MANEPTYTVPVDNAPEFNFPGDPSPTDNTPKPIVIDPNQTYQFGSITQSGQDLVSGLMTPQQNPEIEQLKQVVAQLTQTVQSMASVQQPPQQNQPPETNLSRWVGQRFGEAPSQLDSLTPQDFINGLMAMQQDTQMMFQSIPTEIDRRANAVVEGRVQSNQQVISKKDAMNQAVDLFIQNKVQATGIPATELKKNYEYVIGSLEYSGPYLTSTSPQEISQFVLNELARYDRQLQVSTESSSAAAAAAGKQRNQRALNAAMQDMAAIRANPIPKTSPPQPSAQQPSPPQGVYTPTRLPDSELAFQQLKREKVATQRY